jgi:hypothetical protein
LWKSEKGTLCKLLNSPGSKRRCGCGIVEGIRPPSLGVLEERAPGVAWRFDAMPDIVEVDLQTGFV